MTRRRDTPVLAAITWMYLAWSLLPVAIAIAGSLQVSSQPFALGLDAYRFALQDPDVRQAFAQSVWLAILTVVIAVPLGSALGLALAHLHGRGWRAMRLSLLFSVAMPHAVLAVMLFYLFAFVLNVPFTTIAQLIGHVTVALPFVTLILWTRLAFLDPTFEEQAADLGAPPRSAITRVLLPLCIPAIVVAATVAFALSFNEIPLSRYLCIPNECRTIPVMLGGRAQGEVPPPVLAISVMATLVSVPTLAIAVLVVRGRSSREGVSARAAADPSEGSTGAG